MAGAPSWSLRCLSATGVGKFHIIEGIMYHKMFIRILKENLNSIAEKLGLQGTYILRGDNYLEHTAQSTKL